MKLKNYVEKIRDEVTESELEAMYKELAWTEQNMFRFTNTRKVKGSKIKFEFCFRPFLIHL